MNLRSFRTRLVLLVLVVLIPAGVLVLLSNVARLESDRERIREQTVSAAKLAAASQGYFVREAHQLLKTVVQTHPVEVLSTNPVSCERKLRTLRLLAPDFSDFGLVEKDGKVFCHTIEGVRESEKIVAPGLAQRILEKPEFTVSDYHGDSALGEPILQFAYPIFGPDRRVARFMYASIKLSLLEKALAEVALPEAGVVRVTDRLGNVVAQSRRSDSAAGKAHSSERLPEVAEVAWPVSTNLFETGRADGTRGVFAVSPVTDGAASYLSAQVIVPREILFAQADAEFGASFAGMLLIGALVLALAWWYSRRAFVRPVAAMLAATERLTKGDLSARTGITGRDNELNLLARRLDGMAETLASRQHELEEANTKVMKSNTLLEKRVQERTRELETLNEELEAFCYSVSHDLRAPLRHMDGYARILAADKSVESNTVAQRHLGSITKSAEKMGVLIDDLLRFAKTARQPMSATTIETDSVVKELIREFSAQEAARRIEWNVGPLPAVQGDLTLIRQVWWNLLSNAVKYTRRKDPAKIQVSASVEQREIVFKVEDNGAGFDMKYADKLFGVFQRLHTESEFEGTGIGLANVRRIIERHGGRTWAEGRLGEGAKFYFSLPLNPS